MKAALAAAALAALCCQAAVIEGTVVENRSGRPLARGAVALELMRAGVSARVAMLLADSSGRFVFPNLRPGTYLVSCSRTGFLPDRSGSPIVLREDSRFAVQVRLQRAGAITGSVVDENQVGLPGVMVYAYPADAAPLLRWSGTGTSDDRGVFRIAGLEPGRYRIRTAAHELEDRRGLLPTFAGQTLRAAEALVVEVEADAESPAGSIQPVAGRLGRLAGRISGGIALSVGIYSDSLHRDMMPAGDGSFSLDRLAPGDYEVVAQGQGPAAAWGRVAVGEGQTGVALELAPLPEVAVRVEPPARVVLRLTRQGYARHLPAAPVSSDEPGEVLPGEYTAVAQPPRGFFVQRVDPREFTAEPGRRAEVTVTLGRNPATVKGKVTFPGGGPATGATVYLSTPDPELRARLGGTRQVRAGDDGTYVFADLPPGTYLVSTDPERQPGRSISVGEGEAATVDLEWGGI